MAFFHYDDHGNCTYYGTTPEQYMMAVERMRRYGGFVRDTANDSDDRAILVDRAESVYYAARHRDCVSDVCDQVVIALDALDREDYPVANIAILRAQYILDRDDARKEVPA